MFYLKANKLILTNIVFIFFCAFSTVTCGNSLSDSCTSVRIRTAMSVISFMFSAGAFFWVHSENTIIAKLEKESEEAKQRVNQLTQSITSIKSCMAQLVEEHKHTDRIPFLMSFEALSVNRKVLPVFFQYSDPTTYLFRHSKSIGSARFYPLEVSFIKFDSCDQVHYFFDNSLINIEESESITIDESFVFRFFNLSLLFCGGFVRDSTFSYEHPCYVLVHAYMQLTKDNTYEIFHITNNLLSYKNDFNSTVIHLPVMGSKHTVQENIYSYHSHLVWLESFNLNRRLQLERNTKSVRY